MNEQVNTTNKWHSFIGIKEWVTILTGLLMIVVYSFTDVFSNNVSSVIYHLTQGIYLFCCFIYIFFKLAVQKQFRFGIIKSYDKNDEEASKDIETGNPESGKKIQKPVIIQDVQNGMQVEEKYVEPFFIVIRFLTIIYIILNLSGAGYYFYNTMYNPKKQVVLRQADILTIDNIIDERRLSQKEIIDSVNHGFPKQLFFSAGKVLSMRLDTTGAFVYYYTLRDLHRYLAVSELKLKIFNFTNCKEKLFCNCDSTNICLKNKNIELYYLFVTRKTKKGEKPDTIYYSRIY
jgi:hypothetical protein